MAQTRYALGTFSVAGCAPFAGLVVDERVLAVKAIRGLAAQLGAPIVGDTMLELLEHWEANRIGFEKVANALLEPSRKTLAQGAVSVGQLHVHAPIQPRQILCSGANYHKHVVDLIVDHGVSVNPQMPREQRIVYAKAMMDHRVATGKPFVFVKLASAVIGPNDPVIVPFDMKECDWELELGVVIGKGGRRIPKSEAMDHIAGYTIVNDITGRDFLGRPDMPPMGQDWLAGKNAPSFLPMGPYIVPKAFVPDPQKIQIQLQLDGQMMQNESTADMIFPVARLIEYISTHIQLLPGDVICTGSPAGNGTHYGRFLKDGDVMECELTGLGKQRTPCVAEEVTNVQAQQRFHVAPPFKGQL